MSADPVRIDRLEVTVPASSAAEGRRFGDALARELLRAISSEGGGGRIGRLELTVPRAGDAASIARAVGAAIRGSAR